jgi:hypothetical protein
MRLQLNPSLIPEIHTMDNSESVGQFSSESGKRKTAAVALVSAAMSMLFSDLAMAENAPDRAVISLKYLDYLDSQPDKDRILVRATAVKLIAPISGEWSIGASATTDAISGASPAYHTTALKKMRDTRNAADADITRYFQNTSVTFGINQSKESDYLARGVSLQMSQSSEDRNTTWTGGIAQSKDTINPNNNIVNNEKKKVTDFLIGVTQVLSSDDIVQLNLGLSRGKGYFSDPYKALDSRPRERQHHTVLLRWNHHIESQQSTVRSSYRYFSDNWGIKAHTVGLEYVQPFAQGWSVTPMLRVYSQSAANFYIDAGPSDFPFPPNPPDDAIVFSEDQRLSAFGAHTFGLKVSKQLNDDWLVDVKFEQYTQRASLRFGGEGSPGLATFYARSIQFGVSRQF